MKYLIYLFLLICSSVFASSPLSENLRGNHHFSFYFFDVYEAKLWASDKEIYSEPFSLELIYKRDLVGKEIAKRSITEIEGQGQKLKAKKDKLELLIKIFPNVKKGDSILANYNNESGLTFYLNRKKKIGEIKDLMFAKQFMNIWLSPKTSEKKMRSALLGE
jgi:hypothetical protein